MNEQFLTTIVPLIAVFAIMYLLVIRPQQQKVKLHRQMVNNVRRGDTVVTAGGIIGRVTKVAQADDPEITVEIADGVQIKVMRATLAEVRVKGQPVDAKADKAKLDNKTENKADSKADTKADSKADNKAEKKA